MKNKLFNLNNINLNRTTSKALSIIGSSRINGDRGVYDFYPTPAYAVEKLIEKETFSGNIWECACGQGDISRVFIAKGFGVHSTDFSRQRIWYT